MRPRRPRSPRLRDDRGTATAETAVVLPMVVLLVAVLAFVGLSLTQQVRVESAARTAAREIARGEDTAAAVSAARRVAGPGAIVQVERDGAWVRVEVSRRVGATPGGLLSGVAVTVRGTAVARLEPQLLDGVAGEGAGP